MCAHVCSLWARRTSASCLLAAARSPSAGTGSTGQLLPSCACATPAHAANASTSALLIIRCSVSVKLRKGAQTLKTKDARYVFCQILNSDTCVSPTVTKRNGEPVTGGRRNGTMSETRRGVSKRISQPPRALDNGGATRKSKANINSPHVRWIM